MRMSFWWSLVSVAGERSGGRGDFWQSSSAEVCAWGPTAEGRDGQSSQLHLAGSTEYAHFVCLTKAGELPRKAASYHC